MHRLFHLIALFLASSAAHAQQCDVSLEGCPASCIVIDDGAACGMSCDVTAGDALCSPIVSATAPVEEPPPPPPPPPPPDDPPPSEAIVYFPQQDLAAIADALEPGQWGVIQKGGGVTGIAEVQPTDAWLDEHFGHRNVGTTWKGYHNGGENRRLCWLEDDAATSEVEYMHCLVHGGGHGDSALNHFTRVRFTDAGYLVDRVTDPEPIPEFGTEENPCRLPLSGRSAGHTWGAETIVSPSDYPGFRALYFQHMGQATTGTCPNHQDLSVFPHVWGLDAVTYDWVKLDENEWWPITHCNPCNKFNVAVLPDGRLFMGNDKARFVRDLNGTFTVVENKTFDSAVAFMRYVPEWDQAARVHEKYFTLFEFDPYSVTTHNRPSSYPSMRHWGWDYSPHCDCVILYDGTDTLIRVTKDGQWDITNVPFVDGPAHLWGMWRYVPSLDVFIAQGDAQHNQDAVRLWKPSDNVFDAAPETASLQEAVDTGTATASRLIGGARLTRSDVYDFGGRTLTGIEAGKGILHVPPGDTSVTVKNATMEFGSEDYDRNHAAIRFQSSGDLSIDNVRLSNVGDGILGAAGNGDLTISRFFIDGTGGLGRPDDRNEGHAIYWCSSGQCFEDVGHVLVEDMTVLNCGNSGAFGEVIKTRGPVVEVTRLEVLGDHLCDKAISLTHGGSGFLRDSYIVSSKAMDSSEFIFGHAHESKCADGSYHCKTLDEKENACQVDPTPDDGWYCKVTHEGPFVVENTVIECNHPKGNFMVKHRAGPGNDWTFINNLMVGNCRNVQNGDFELPQESGGRVVFINNVFCPDRNTCDDPRLRSLADAYPS